MIRNKAIVRRVVEMVIAKMLTRAEAAELLQTSVRTIGNYKRRYATRGPSGLLDRRHGNYRKLSAESERRIIESKVSNGARSASWIQRRLKLPVSVESVRRVLVKHGLASHSIGAGKRAGTAHEVNSHRRKGIWIQPR